MTVCLSTNGSITSTHDGPPTRLLVPTLDGIAIVTRQRAGAPWLVKGRTLDGLHASSLVVEPIRGGIFAGVHGGGLYFSGDDGESWQRRANGLTIEHVFSLAVANEPDGPVIYAGTEPVSLFCSRDYGESWKELKEIRNVPGTEKWAFPGPSGKAHTKALTVDPRNPLRIYAAIEQGALLKTEDGGASWKEIDEYSQSSDELYRDVHRVVLRPSNPDEIFMTTGVGLYRASVRGKKWEHLTGTDFRIGYPDHLIFSPDEQTIFMSGAASNPTTWLTLRSARGTVLRSRDDGRNWEPANRGLPDGGRANIEAMHGASYPGGFSLFAGNTDGKVFCSEDGGENWSLVVAGLKPVSKGPHFRMLQEAAPAR